jgi:hypothetical protein
VPSSDASAVLALQRTLGNRTVSRLLARPRSATAAGVVQRTPSEAAHIETLGRRWAGFVYRNPDAVVRQQYRDPIKALLTQYGVRVGGPPWLVGEPLLYIGGVPYSYAAIAAAAAALPNAAQDLLSWMTGPTALGTLDVRLRALAWITHFAEVARWMTDTPAHLRTWLQEIVAGNATWQEYTTYVPASLTYAQDQAANWDPDEDG